MEMKVLEEKIERFLLLKKQNPKFEQIIKDCEGKEYELKLSSGNHNFSFGSILGSEILELFGVLLKTRKEEFKNLAKEMGVE